LITPTKINLRKINKYKELLTDDGKNVTRFFPLCKLKDSSAWTYNPDKSSQIGGGTMPKFFVRCDSGYFGELITELKKDNCSYVTYINDLVKGLGEGTEKIPLSKLSIMLKSVHGNSNALENEEICSRIANIFGIPTAYNKVVEIEGNKYVASVDFMSQGQEYSNLFEEDKPLVNVNCFEDFEEVVIKDRLTSLLNSGKITQENFDELVESFVETYFFRNYVLSDDDYNLHNIRLLHNKETNKYEWAPCFDYEYAFTFDNSYFMSASDVEYIFYKYSQIAKKIYDKYNNILSSDKIYSCLKIMYDESTARKYSGMIKHRLNDLLEIYEMIREVKGDGKPM